MWSPYPRKLYKIGRVTKEIITPNPTKAAVKRGDKPPIMAKAPADTIGGIPASKIDTLAAWLSRFNMVHISNAVAGAITSFINNPAHKGFITLELSFTVS